MKQTVIDLWAQTKPLRDVIMRILRPFIQAISGFLEDDGLVLAGHMAFITILSMFPFIIFLVALSGFIGQTEAGTEALAFLFNTMPEMVRGVLEPPIMEVVTNQRADLLTFGIVFTIWTASSGLEALRAVLNRALGAVEHRPTWRRRVVSLGFVVMFSGLIVIGVMMLVLGPVLWQAANDLCTIEADWTVALAWFCEFPETWGVVWVGVRYTITALMFLTVITVLYQLLPARRLPLKHTIPGAFLAQALWLAAASGFSQYLKYSADYSVTYGSLGGIVIALIFFYVMGAIFILGAEFNAALAHIYEERHKNEDQKASAGLN